ncbi:ArsB/NhaD family transporter [Lignipirellula cremea]|uniref:Arsenical pump membrane protein n=1 Tax=Lignipirellula cremea TaxID=2528010 RepID=A0A518E074_9BACT|nr:ArsB/NhaD family transporter [Lignipirellula cremea]QDU97485.1 Arsenical pump membrane protein [Lignipirellula cremea]
MGAIFAKIHATAPQQQPLWVMLLFVGVMMLTYVGVAVDGFHKTVAALSGAAVLVVLSLWLGVFKEYDQIHTALAHDLGIFGVIIGTGVLVGVTGKSGLFHFLSILIVKATGGRAALLYTAICGLTFLFVALLTIVPAMLILCSLVLVICRTLEYNPKPFLVSVAICANSGAIVTFASGLPNIMIGTAASLPYMHFILVSAPYALISLLIAMAMLRILYRGELPWRQDAAETARLKTRIDAFDPWALVENRGVLIRSAVILMLTVVGFAMAQPLGVGMDFIAMVGGTAALVFAGKTVEDAIGKVNWTVILFFTGLFVIIACVKETGALEALATMIKDSSESREVLIPLLTMACAFASAIVDNIPVAATLIPVVKDLGAPAEPLWWSLVLGCNLGGNGTPIGSISCVIALHTLHKEAHITVGWGEFLKVGGSIMVVQSLGAVVYLLAFYWLDLFPTIASLPAP